MKKNGYNLHYVIQGWKQIWVNLNFLNIDIDQDVEIQLLDKRVFILWYQKQVIDVYIMAYFLYLSNHHVINTCLIIEIYFASILRRFFKQYEVDHLMDLS